MEERQERAGCVTRCKRFFTPAWGEGLKDEASGDLESYRADTLRRSERILLVFLSFASYCTLTLLGAHDSDLIQPDPTITLPLVGAKIAFSGFVIAAPVILVALASYLHIYLEHLRHLEPARPDLASPALLSLPHWPAQLFVEITAYWLGPAVLVLFFRKALIFDLADWLWVLACGLLALLMGLAFRRRTRYSSWWVTSGRVVAFCLALFGVGETVGPALQPVYIDERGYAWRKHYRSFDLRFSDLSGKRFGGDILVEVDLSGAVLKQAVLVGANLANATLRGADLREADLSRAYLSNVVVDGADFGGAILDYTVINVTDLTHALRSDPIWWTG
jgi:hypothetical protein